MEYLTQQNRRNEGDDVSDADHHRADGKNVVIIGGGDTGADCLGTAHRQGAASVHQFELLPKPPGTRGDVQPLADVAADFPRLDRARRGRRAVYTSRRPSSRGATGGSRAQGSHGDAGERDGRLTFRPVAGSEFTLECDLVLLAMGFVGPERGAVDQLGVKLTDRGTVARRELDDERGRCVRRRRHAARQSLVVWAIAEGRSAARGVDQWLMVSRHLPPPV